MIQVLIDYNKHPKKKKETNNVIKHCGLKKLIAFSTFPTVFSERSTFFSRKRKKKRNYLCHCLQMRIAFFHNSYLKNKEKKQYCIILMLGSGEVW